VRGPTNPKPGRARCAEVAAVCLLLLLASCSADASSNEDDGGRFSELPTYPIDVEAPPSPTPTEDTTPPIPEFVSRLLSPGPTLDAAERIFFRNGRDLWAIAGDEVGAALEEGTRFGPYDTSPHGQRAAVVLISDVDSRPAEVVHVIANGVLGPPLTEPRFTSGANAASPIRALAWSRDATRIGIVYDEPTIAILEIARPDGGPPQIASEIRLPDEYRRIQRIDWSTTENGLAILAETPSGTGSLWLASLNGELFEVGAASLDGSRSLADAAWLPGRGRIAVIEERTETAPAIGGSMFSIAPDGSGRELLVSSGNFAPAAEIVKLAASPGGGFIAFSVNVPGSQGEDTFHSAWLMNLDSAELVRVPVNMGFRVTDLWWTTEGLLWRGVHRNAPVVDSISTYAGSEPFIIGRFNPETGESRSMLQAAAN
jgi:hypothetical protein